MIVVGIEEAGNEDKLLSEISIIENSAFPRSHLDMFMENAVSKLQSISDLVLR